MQPVNALRPTLVTVPGSFMSASAVQPRKQSSGMAVTPAGMVTSVSAVQPVKADLSMVVTVSGMGAAVSALQLSNARSPMAVTVPAYLTFSSFVQSAKHLPGTAVMAAGRVVFVRLAQVSNAPRPRLCSPSGSVTAVSPSPARPKSPISVTPLGMDRPVSLEHMAMP